MRNRQPKSEMETLVHTMEIRHICPTSPDTMRVHPFKDSDPFVIADADLQLEDEEMADGSKTHEKTTVPHVYFVGNM